MTSYEPPAGAALVDAAALSQIVMLHSELARRVGCPEHTTPAVLLAAVDEALREAAEDPTPPAGTELLDSVALAQLREDAELGRTHRERALVDAAVRQGRIPPASRQTWLTLLDTDPNAESTLAGLRAGSVPLSPIGYSTDREAELAG